MRGRGKGIREYNHSCSIGWEVPAWWSDGAPPAEPRRAGDAWQRPLRSRCQARLTPSVDMTSDGKDGEQLFYICLMFFSFA